MKNLTQQDFLLLAEVHRRQKDEENYGVKIAEEADFKLGSIYDSLRRLQAEGLLEAREAHETHQRGGRRRKVFNLTSEGVNKLTEWTAFMRTLLSDLKLE